MAHVPAPRHPGDEPLKEADAPASTEQRSSVCLSDLLAEASHWSSMLVTDHLDPPARFALFSACTATKRLVLDTAGHATFMLNVIPAHMRKPVALLAVKGALQIRGMQPTKLKVIAEAEAMCRWGVGFLAPEINPLQVLEVQVCPKDWSVPERKLTTACLSTIGRRCPNLRVLTLAWAPATLPSPADTFPGVRELHVHTVIGDVEGDMLASSLAPYMPQLTILTIENQFCFGPGVVGLMLGADHMGLQLRTLSVPTKLTDEVLANLLRYAPVLEELQLEGIDLQSDTHANTPVTWRHLVLEIRSMRPSTSQGHYDLPLSSLTRLPLAPDLDLTWSCAAHGSVCVSCDITGAQAVAAATRHKVSRFTKGGPRVMGPLGVRPPRQGPGGEGPGQHPVFFRMLPDEEVDVAEEHVALRAGLSLLRGWRVAEDVTPCVTLHRWTMSPEVLPELRELPHWGEVSFDSFLNWLPGLQLYAPLLDLLPSSYVEVHVHGDGGGIGGLTAEQVESVCLGAPVNRTAEAPLCIVLSWVTPAVVRGIQDRMRVGPWQHVMVEERYGY